MIKDFKFLTKNDKTIFNGQMSREAIQYLYDYNSRVRSHERTTAIATYRMVDYTYGDGNIIGGTVNSYPLDTPDIRVTYKIRNQEVTEYTIDIDYFNTMGQMVNQLIR